MFANTNLFTIAQQDSIIITARNAALGQHPAGKQLYRLTVQRQFASPNSVIIAIGFYGYCMNPVKVDQTRGIRSNGFRGLLC